MFAFIQLPMDKWRYYSYAVWWRMRCLCFYFCFPTLWFEHLLFKYWKIQWILSFRVSICDLKTRHGNGVPLNWLYTHNCIFLIGDFLCRVTPVMVKSSVYPAHFLPFFFPAVLQIQLYSGWSIQLTKCTHYIRPFRFSLFCKNWNHPPFLLDPTADTAVDVAWTRASHPLAPHQPSLPSSSTASSSTDESDPSPTRLLRFSIWLPRRPATLATTATCARLESAPTTRPKSW